MVTCLSALPNLKDLWLGFRPPRSRLDRPNQPLPPLPPVVLPALTRFVFHGASEYIEDLVSQINIPRLDNLAISFLNQLIFDTPHLHDFLARTVTLGTHSESASTLSFNDNDVQFNLGSRLSLRISCTKSDWQLSSISQVCNSFSPPFSTLERLDICSSMYLLHWQDGVESTQWLELLRPFTALKDLYLDEELALHVTPALPVQDLVGERVTEVLPALQNLFIQRFQLSGLAQEAIGKFVAERQLSGLPVAVRDWDGQS